MLARPSAIGYSTRSQWCRSRCGGCVKFGTYKILHANSHGPWLNALSILTELAHFRGLRLYYLHIVPDTYLGSTYMLMLTQAATRVM